MIFKLLNRIFGSKNERSLKKLIPVIEAIKSFHEKIKNMSDEQLAKQTAFFKSRFDMGESLEEILPEAFATVKEASSRCLGMEHYEVQLIGGIILHEGKIAEMKTGEGKTLVATLPVYLNAITNRSVHVVTVNDYLADRDSNWMGKLYNFLDISVGTLKHGMSDKDRKIAYSSDVIYGTNNEFGFDYLKDNMKFTKDTICQGDLYYSIVDEVDSILIDEARTPLIISGPAEKSNNLYKKINSLIYELNSKLDYKIDEKARSVVLTESGISKVERRLSIGNIYDSGHIEVLHHVNQALKAHTLFKCDIDYILKDGQVIIVDEFTGRLMPGRRYGEGLHQALEAKERVEIENENQTLATITFQNFFRMYEKLAGMTGTAMTEAEEFKKIYNFDVLSVPTNKLMIRKDFSDVIYKTSREKFKAVVDDIKILNQKEQPILVGTASINNSEILSKKLKRKGIKHSVLNAKNHEKEAEIIALAGQKNSVTISTNMAGRGTDIVLGDGVNEIGGLHVIGTERHESRRIDNQLRGRSGRQGDNGSSRFYLALDDNLLRIFGGDKITSIMGRLGMSDGEPITHTLISKSIENAQSRVESRNFDIRKHLLEYDDVLNQQREVIYKQRYNLLGGENLKETIKDIILDKTSKLIDYYFNTVKSPNCTNQTKLTDIIIQEFGCVIPNINVDRIEKLDSYNLFDLISSLIINFYSNKELMIGNTKLRQIERMVMLHLVDSFWKDHLLNMEHLKEGVGLSSYAHQNPLLVYKKEGFEMFEDMIFRIRDETVKIILRIKEDSLSCFNNFEENKQEIFFSSNKSDSVDNNRDNKKQNKIGRNSSCPCNSGLKYKKCCGR